MTVLSAQSIRRLGLLTPCAEPYRDARGNSCGLSACGYDLTLHADVVVPANGFVLAGAHERFDLPANVVGIVHDKSSLARIGLAVQNTVAEPGWRGYLTLELTNHTETELRLSKGDAIAQVLFHFLNEPTERPYAGLYQNQEPGPQTTRSRPKERSP